MPLKIRFATAADIEPMLELLWQLFSIETDFIIDADKQRRGLQQLLGSTERHAGDKPSTRLWVVQQAGQVIGMCSLQVLISTAQGGEVGLIEDVIVHREYRRRGIGQALLLHVEQWAKEQGLLRLQLLADRDNLQAHRFYRRQHWQESPMQAWRKFLC